MWTIIVIIINIHIDVGVAVDWLRRDDFYYNFTTVEVEGQAAARDACHNLGADLISILDQNEQRFVVATLEDVYRFPDFGVSTSRRYWIGLYTDRPCNNCGSPNNGGAECTQCRHGWRWMDGNNYQFQDWLFNQPNDNVSCCSIYEQATKWVDTECNRKGYSLCKAKGACLHSPCVHGVCNGSHNPFSYQCICDHGYEGTNCDVDIDECENGVCGRAGKCINGPGSFSCECQGGWEGATCEQDIDECENRVCKHGKCENTMGGYSCSCSSGYLGKNCDVKEKDTTGWIAGIVALGVVCLAVAVAFVVYVVCNKRQQGKKDRAHPDQSGNDADHSSQQATENISTVQKNDMGQASKYEPIDMKDMSPAVQKGAMYETINLYEN